MLRIFTSHKLERLARRLAEERRGRLPADPLEPERFVVQNHGLAQWLTLRLGREEGIAANLAFEFPAERLWSTARILYPGLPRVLPSDKGPMAWEIYGLLQSGDHDVLRPLRSYVETGREDGRELRRWKLARKIADVFDQYLVYRPDWMLAWEEDRQVTGRRDEAWQAWLWGSLVDRWIRRCGDEPWLHRARLHRFLEEAIREGSLEEGDLPGGISVFGVTAMPPAVARLLVHSADVTDVTFYQCLPAGVEAGEGLAGTWGTSGRNFMEELRRLAGEYQPSAEVRSLDPDPGDGTQPAASTEGQPDLFTADPGEEPGDNMTLLGALQRRIRGRGPGKEGAEGLEWDDSLQVHSCHSALREVQVLYDRILALLEEHPGLGPGDILVVNPEMERYAPLVESVFGVSEPHLPDLPYRIVDGQASAAPVEKSMLALLELAASRFKVSDVLDFLELEPVRARRDFSGEELDRIEKWVEDNRVRWGIDEAFKKELDLPATSGNTWRSGLSRMLLGYAMEPSEEDLYRDMVPYGQITGTEDAVMLGELSAWLERLFDLHRFARSPHTLREWSDRLRAELRWFMESGDPHTRDWFRVAGALERLAEQGEASGFGDRAGFALVADWLKSELDATSFGGNPSGGVTFSSMISLRNIPYKVICLTGLSDGSYPRSQPSPAFDLTRSEPRAGDRSRLEEDRQVMLEALNSARHTLYISYVGQSNRQEAEFPPSVVVSELLDRAGGLCGMDYEEAEGRVVRHPLQPFGSAYFGQGGGPGDPLFSYSRHYREIAARMGGEREEDVRLFPEALPPPEESGERLRLASLVDFVRHPSRYLLRRRLALWLDERTREEDDREPFEMEHLERFLMGQEMLDRQIEGEDTSGRYAFYRAGDRLPGGWPGREAFRQLHGNVEDFARSVRPHLESEALDPLPVEIETERGVLGGRLDRLYAEGQVFYRFGSRKARDLAELWVRHLALQCAEDAPSRVSRMFNRDSDGQTVGCLLPEMSRGEAAGRLEWLLDWHGEGLRLPQPFFPESSLAYAQKRRSGGTREAAVRSAGKKWKDDYAPYPLEGDDPYNRRLWEPVDVLQTEAFGEQAVAFWGPVLELLEETS